MFYREKHAQIITKLKSSIKLDILWTRLKSPCEEIIMGFFYAPGVNHVEEIRMEFCDELRKGVDTYMKENKRIYLMGDSNARLGEFTQDENINGDIINNQNKKIFLGFLRYTGMYCLNSIFARGQPTYEIMGKKRSIIDLCLTNSLNSIKEFNVMPNILGMNAQTCHKILQLRIQIQQKATQESHQTVRTFRHCKYESLLKVKGEVARRLRILRLVRRGKKPIPNPYSVLSKIYFKAKERNIGYRKARSRIIPENLIIRSLQEKIKETSAMIEREVEANRTRKKARNKEIDVLVHRLSLLENELYNQWESNRHKQFAKWLNKLNGLNFHKATRTFYSEINRKARKLEHFGPIVNKDRELSTSSTQCLTNWKEFYADLYKGPNKKHTHASARNTKISPTPRRSTKAHSKDLDREIKMEEIVDAIFTLKADTAAGADSILSRDLIELMTTEILSEHENNREIMNFVHETL